METENRTRNVYCKKIVFELPGRERPEIILGVILNESELFFKVQTYRRLHIIAKKNIVSITDTSEVFKGLPPTSEPGETNLNTESETEPGSNFFKEVEQ